MGRFGRALTITPGPAAFRTYNSAMHVWRDRLNRWLGPVARNSPLSPNEISLLALLIAMMGAVALLGRHFLIALPFIAVAGLTDALDGAVARVQGKESRFGDFLDHCLDRMADTTLAAAWLIANDVLQPLALAAIILVMMNGYVGTQIEATFRRRNYESLGRGEFVLALIVFPIVSHLLFANGWASRRFGPFTVADWMAALLIAFAVLGIVQRFMLARRLDRT